MEIELDLPVLSDSALLSLENLQHYSSSGVAEIQLCKVFSNSCCIHICWNCWLSENGKCQHSTDRRRLSRCLTRNIFDSNNYGVRCCRGCKNDEEFVNGDEVGRLECKHWFHEGCIQQWLRQKNWCPICKALAELPCQPSPPF